MPFPYFHLLNIIMMANCLLLSYAMVPTASWPLSLVTVAVHAAARDPPPPASKVFMQSVRPLSPVIARRQRTPTHHALPPLQDSTTITYPTHRYLP